MNRRQTQIGAGSVPRSRRGAGFALVMLVAASPLLADCPPGAEDLLTEEQCSTLLRGGEVFHTYKLDDGSKDTRGVAARWIPSAPEVVWSVVTDNDHFEDFICSVSRSEFDAATGVNLQVIKVPFWIDVQYRVRIENSITGSGADARWRSAWTYVDGDLDSTEGAWTLRPHEGGTLVLYEVRTDPGFGKRWIYTPERAEVELRKLLADVVARAADAEYRCP